MRVALTRFYVFEACHHLPGFDGPAGRPHGHTYTVGVTAEVAGDCDLPTENIDHFWDDFRGVLDHRDLNESLPCVTTVEAIAKWLLDAFHAELPAITRVYVQEGRLRRAEASL